MRKNSLQPSKRGELAPEKEPAEQKRCLADQNAGKHRSFDANESDEPACRRGYAYGEWNVVERTAWKKDQLGDDRCKNCCRHRARPDNDFRIFIEPASQHQSECTPKFIRQKPDQD